MISAKRMVEIFRRRGGREFANLSEKLTADQLAYLEEMAGAEPVIAVLSSESEWFVVTKSQFVLRQTGGLQRIPLHQIRSVHIPKRDPKDAREWRKIERIKIDGGDLDVGLQDGAKLRLKVEPGGPYFGLMNVLLRIAGINNRQNTKVNGQDVSPVANDERPTTQL
jgi:hypothetical protein